MRALVKSWHTHNNGESQRFRILISRFRLFQWPNEVSAAEFPMENSPLEIAISTRIPIYTTSLAYMFLLDSHHSSQIEMLISS